MSSLDTNTEDRKIMEDSGEVDWWNYTNERRIYVGGVPPGMNSKDVYEFFTKFGLVEFARVHYGKYGNSDFAFVTFKSRETRKTALKAGDAELTLWDGKKLKVGAARSKENIPPEIKSWTWFRSAGRASAGSSGVQPVQQHQLPLSDLQYILPGALSHSQYLPFNNNSSEQQVIFNNNSSEQQMINSNNSAEQQMIYNNNSFEQQMILNNNSIEQRMLYNNNSTEEQMIYLPFANYLTNPVAYYYPPTGMMFPQYQQQQFSQYEPSQV